MNEFITSQWKHGEKGPGLDLRISASEKTMDIDECASSSSERQTKQDQSQTCQHMRSNTETDKK